MPFKSKAQVAKFRSMVSSGEMSQKEFDKWAKETPNMHSLPERIAESKKDKRVRGRKEESGIRPHKVHKDWPKY